MAYLTYISAATLHLHLSRNTRTEKSCRSSNIKRAMSTRETATKCITINIPFPRAKNGSHGKFQETMKLRCWKTHNINTHHCTKWKTIFVWDFQNKKLIRRYIFLYKPTSMYTTFKEITNREMRFDVDDTLNLLLDAFRSNLK